MLEEFSPQLGVIAMTVGTLMALAYFPQAYKIYKRRSCADISLLMFLVFVVGGFTWLLYGISINNITLIVPNVIGILGTASVIVLYFRYRKK